MSTAYNVPFSAGLEAQRKEYFTREILRVQPERVNDSNLYYGNVELEYLRLVNDGIIESGSSVVVPPPTGGDDTALIQEVLDRNKGKTVYLSTKSNYIVTSELIISNETVLDLNESTLDARTMPFAATLGERVVIKAWGTRDAPISVATAIAQNSRIISGISSTTALKVDDYILIRNEESPVLGLTRSDRDKGEMSRITSVDSGTQITIATGALFAYGTTGLVIEKVNPITVKICNGKILTAGIGSAHSGIDIKNAVNPVVEEVSIKGAENIAILMNTTWEGKVIGGKMENSTSNAGIGNTGYGICFSEGSRHCLAKDVNFYNCRHFIAGGGFWPASFITIENCNGVYSSNAAYDTHESCFYWTFRGNTASQCALGFGMRGQYITVENNKVIDCTGPAYQARTYDGVTEQRGIIFRFNEAIRCVNALTLEGLAISAEPNCLKINCELVGNTFRDCGNASTDAVLVRNFNGLKIQDNSIIRAGRHAIYLLGLSSSAPSKNLTLEGNYIDTPGGNGIDIDFVDDINGVGGIILTPSLNGIDLNVCNGFSYQALKVKTPIRAGLNVLGGSNITLSSPVIDGGANAGYDAVRISGSTDTTVNGGKLASARNAFYSTTTEYVILNGINMRGAASGARFSVDAVNKQITANIL